MSWIYGQDSDALKEMAKVLEIEIGKKRPKWKGTRRPVSETDRYRKKIKQKLEKLASKYYQDKFAKKEDFDGGEIKALIGEEDTLPPDEREEELFDKIEGQKNEIEGEVREKLIKRR